MDVVGSTSGWDDSTRATVVAGRDAAGPVAGRDAAVGVGVADAETVGPGGAPARWVAGGSEATPAGDGAAQPTDSPQTSPATTASARCRRLFARRLVVIGTEWSPCTC